MNKMVMKIWGGALLLCLLCLPACDSGGNGGGGVATTTGYTQADLAGHWSGYWTTANGLLLKVVVEFDETGKPTYAAGKWGAWEWGSGELTVSSDGVVRGEFVLRFLFSPPAGSFGYAYRKIRMAFLSATKIKGEWVERHVLYHGGVSPPVYGPLYSHLIGFEKVR